MALGTLGKYREDMARREFLARYRLDGVLIETLLHIPEGP